MYNYKALKIYIYCFINYKAFIALYITKAKAGIKR